VKFSPREKCAAFTLVEVVLTTAILTLVLGSLALFGSRSAGALGEGTLQSDLDTNLQRTLARMNEELLSSGLADLALTPGADGLTYRRSEGVVNGAIRWSAPSRLAFAFELGELDDGLDNNGNGLIDEGVVQWTRQVGQPDEQTVTLCHGVSECALGEVDNELDDDGDGQVDERGLVFELDGGTLRVSLKLERKNGSAGQPVTRSAQVTLQPRN